MLKTALARRKNIDVERVTSSHSKPVRGTVQRMMDRLARKNSLPGTVTLVRDSHAALWKNASFAERKATMDADGSSDPKPARAGYRSAEERC